MQGKISAIPPRAKATLVLASFRIFAARPGDPDLCRAEAYDISHNTYSMSMLFGGVSLELSCNTIAWKDVNAFRCESPTRRNW